MGEEKTFGIPRATNVMEFEARYKGPIGILRQSEKDADLAAVHQAGQATLGLVRSVQTLAVDTSVTPHRIEGTASFYTEDNKEILLSKFTGISTPKPGEGGVEEATVFVNFTGGTGRFERATGTATVEADLHLLEGFSEGVLKGTVLLPSD